MNKLDDNYIKKFQKEELSKVINIEIGRSKRRAGAWDIRIGDVEGSVNGSNMSKSDILELIAEEMNQYLISEEVGK